VFSRPSRAQPGEGVALRDPANLVCRRAIWYWATRALLCWLAVVAVMVLVLVQSGSGSRGYLVLAAIALVALLHASVMPHWRYRVHR